MVSGLAKQGRYAGQCRKFYSIAEHLVHCRDLAAMSGASSVERRHVLIHDAHEAWNHDISRPLKRGLPQYRAISDMIQEAVLMRFGMDDTGWHERIKRYDNALLKAEMQQLLPSEGSKLNIPGDVPDTNIRIRCFGPRRSAMMLWLALEEEGFVVLPWWKSFGLRLLKFARII